MIVVGIRQGQAVAPGPTLQRRWWLDDADMAALKQHVTGALNPGPVPRRNACPRHCGRRDDERLPVRVVASKQIQQQICVGVTHQLVHHFVPRYKLGPAQPDDVSAIDLVPPSGTGRALDLPRVRAAIEAVSAEIRAEVGEARFAAGRFVAARALFERLVAAERCEEFLTLPAYEALLAEETAT